jgi:hydroxymethylpyrimidine/phosphomethylpyrimidine kinase
MAPTLSHLNADLPPVGIKIGMLGTAEAVAAVSAYLCRRRGPKIPIVLDPVLRSSSGTSLLTPKGLSVLQAELLPLVDWITPNRDELSELSGVTTRADSDIEEALWALNRLHPHLNIVATGGDHTGEGTVDTLLVPPGDIYRFEGERIATTSTHGTGCAFSSALLARLVLGYAPQDAVGAAKRYVTEALKHAPGLGHGHGPLNLLWPLKAR